MSRAARTCTAALTSTTPASKSPRTTSSRFSAATRPRCRGSAPGASSRRARPTASSSTSLTTVRLASWLSRRSFCWSLCSSTPATSSARSRPCTARASTGPWSYTWRRVSQAPSSMGCSPPTFLLWPSPPPPRRSLRWRATTTTPSGPSSATASATTGWSTRTHPRTPPRQSETKSPRCVRRRTPRTSASTVTCLSPRSQQRPSSERGTPAPLAPSNPLEPLKQLEPWELLEPLPGHRTCRAVTWCLKVSDASFWTHRRRWAGTRDPCQPWRRMRTRMRRMRRRCHEAWSHRASAYTASRACSGERKRPTAGPTKRSAKSLQASLGDATLTLPTRREQWRSFWSPSRSLRGPAAMDPRWRISTAWRQRSRP
mmetsp:Transcript_55159/g.130963  ORF Transcript_55159/g.130963 Transcript_55159/m.130963 type:complete len:371 (+) Transcript_55159:434-1546(+)